MFMSTREQLESCIEALKNLSRRSRLLPPGVVASELNVSKQRLNDLIEEGRIQTETLAGSRMVLVSSATKFAVNRWQRANDRMTD
jgi:hypothetical protein